MVKPKLYTPNIREGQDPKILVTTHLKGQEKTWGNSHHIICGTTREEHQIVPCAKQRLQHSTLLGSHGVTGSIGKCELGLLIQQYFW